jgi:PAS domain S-box-containing protein
MAPPTTIDECGAAALFAGPGELRERCRALDWSATPLGPVETWPDALRAVVRLCLDCVRPMCVSGGPALVQIYNDAYAAAVGAARHPGALGRAARDVWGDLWDQIGPEYALVMAGGPAVERTDDAPYFIDRGSGPEETYWTYAISPVRDDGGCIVACHTLIAETTGRVHAEAELREREGRQAFLLELSDTLRAEPSADAVANRAIRMLSARMNLDRCYITFYRVADDRADVPYQVGNDSVPALPDTLRLSDFPDAFHQVLDKTVVIEDDFERRGLSDAEKRNSQALGMRALLASTLRKGEHNPVSSMAAVSATPRRWTPGEVALVEEVAERTWAAMEHARAEAALRESEERYRTLFETMDEGFVLCQLLRDHEGAVHDYRILDVNPAYERQTGTKAADVAGRLRSDFDSVPNRRVLELCANAVDTGESIRFEYFNEGLNRWFDVGVIPRPGDQFAAVFANVTERKRTEDALRASERRLRRMTNVERVGVLLFDAASGVLLEANDAFLHMTGYTRDQVTAHALTWRVMTPSEYTDASEAQLDVLDATGRIGPYEKEYVCADGTRSWMLVVGAALGDGTTVEYCIDVSDRKRAEQALRESEARQVFLLTLSDALRQAADPRVIQQSALRILAEHLHLDRAMFTETSADGAWIEITGSYAREGFPAIPARLAARDFGETTALLHTGNLLVLPDVDDEPALGEREKANIRALGARAVIAMPFARGGRWIASLVAHRGTPHAWTPDEIALIEEAGERIWAAIERARAELALRLSQTRYRALVDNVHDYAIFLLDTDGLIVEWTEGARRVKGYEADEVLGRHFGMFYPEGDRLGGVPEHELRVAAETGRVESEGWRVRRSGERFWVDEIMTAVHDSAGALVGFTRICRDLTHRMLADSAAQRERDDRDREQFRRQLAAAEENERRRLARELHDQLGQHLAALSLGLDEVRRMVTDAGGTDRGMLRSAMRLQALQELATAITTDARNLALELRPPELDDVGLASALETYVARWSERTRVAADVELSGIDGKVVAGEVGTAIYRIVQEALTNVVKHAQAEHVSVILEDAEQGTRLIIEDDGRGFDLESTIQRSRAQSRLGLAGMRERAMLAGGTFTLESEAGRGTTIYVTIPTERATTGSGAADHGTGTGGRSGS